MTTTVSIINQNQVKYTFKNPDTTERLVNKDGKILTQNQVSEQKMKRFQILLFYKHQKAAPGCSFLMIYLKGLCAFLNFQTTGT